MNKIVKRVLSMFAVTVLCLIAACGLFCTTETVEAATTGQYQVTASALYVRKGPGTSYGTLGTLSKGTIVKVTSVSENNWGCITYKNSKGWICLTFASRVSTSSSVTTTTTTEVSGPATTESQPSSSGTVSYKYRVTASLLNMRSGPSTSYSVVTTIPGQTVLKVTTIDANNWGKTSYNGASGWISMAFCQKVTDTQTQSTTQKVTTTEAATTTTTEQKPSQSTVQTNVVYKISASYLNVRKGPGTDYDVIACYPADTLLTISEISSNNWGKFTREGITGWVSLSYCVKVESTGGNTSGVTEAATAATTEGQTESGSGSSQKVSIDTTIRNNLPSNNGRWSVYVLSRKTGEETVINNQKMQAASLIKLYIMGAVYEDYTYLTSTYGKTKIDQLLKYMITVSDNDSANTLVKYLGRGNSTTGMSVVNKFCANHGYVSSHMGRLLLASNAYDDNYTSVVDCGNFLNDVRTGKLTHASEMFAFLAQQERRHKIPSQLPTGTLVANKTGELSNVENDAGIIYSKDSSNNDIILVFMSEKLSDVGLAQKTIGKISRIIYDYYN